MNQELRTEGIIGSANPGRGDLWSPFPAVKADLDRVQTIIAEQARSGSSRLDEALRDFSQRTGKLLRPAFLLLSARCNPRSRRRRLRLFSAGGQAALQQPLEDRFYYLAAAVELLHLATLIHDDVVDDSDTRRGRPTLNSLYGDRDAVLLGDLLFARCFALVAKHATLKNAQSMATAVSRICDGEVAEAINDRGTIPSARRYVRRVAAKTALLFALSFQVGADEAGANERQVEAFRRAGYNVGVAFQIIDDVLDLTGDTSVVGKTTGSDLLQGVVTLPVVLAMQNDGTGVLRKNVESVLSGDGDVRAVADMVTAGGGVGLAKERAAQYSRRALAEVGRAASTPARGVLETVILELTARAY